MPSHTAEHALPLAMVSVHAHRERGAARRISALAGDAVGEVFSLAREVPRRVDGAWRITAEPLYPGYVFVEVKDAVALSERLPADLAPISHDNTIDLLDSEEAGLLRALGGRQHVVRMSYGDIVNGRLQVHTGALRGIERCVARIDRHRRRAWIDLPHLPLAASRRLAVGLEVRTKS